MDKAAPAPSLATLWPQLRKPLELEVARGCPDTVIVGTSIGTYTKLWAQRVDGAGDEDVRLALSLARGLRDYATMPPAERKRRAMAAIDLLRQREEGAHPALPVKAEKKAPVKRPAARVPREIAPPKEAANALPDGHELLESPVALLAPRAKWPSILAQRLDIDTVRELLYHIPREWVEITAINAVLDGGRAAVVGTVKWREYEQIKTKNAPHKLYKYTLGIDDGTGEAWVISFSSEPERARDGRRMSWSPGKLLFNEGQKVFVTGRVDRTGKLVQIRMEDIFELGETDAATMHPGAKVPLYPLTAGVFQSQVRRAVMRALVALGEQASTNALVDPLPGRIREEYTLLPLLEAPRELHLPRTPQRHEEARRRLAFEEFLIPQLVLAQRRWEDHHRQDTIPFTAPETLPDLVTRMAPFEPTPAQVRVLGDIEDDLRSTRPMNRLLQGDVGSGKTLVAAAALAFAARAGQQAAMMAPTEILAEQLYLVLTRMLKPLGIAPVLLTGSRNPAERREALQAIANGSAQVAVGTQALIQTGVVFQNLGLVVVDEQHRFGVMQRATLRGKGKLTNTLVMTATPIPRTLALTVFGDLDISVLDGMPPGRHPVETRWAPSTDLRESYEFIRREIATGRQAYVLCPLVEQSDLLQADAATQMAEELQKRIFPDFTIGLLHGRMRPEEKDAAMEAFRSGETQVLACTTVVEVGVDVPNASVMLIHNAERFGLAQLHQLRGRVGRAAHQSYCILATLPRFNPEMPIEDERAAARKRLKFFLESQDGFAIAEADLQLRGPGEYLGTRQSGLVDYQIGSLLRDAESLEQARHAAHAIIADDPTLKLSAHAELRKRAHRLKTKVDQFRE